MKQFIILFASFFYITISFGQLAKGNWIVGGGATFSNYNTKTAYPPLTAEGNYTYFSISPNVGYFFADKFSVGFRGTFSSIKGDEKDSGGSPSYSNTQSFFFGGFARFYFLPVSNRTNILIDLSYQKGIIRGNAKGDANSLSILGGPVIYFNSSVGIEFLMGYASSKYEYENGVKEQKNGIQIGIGFQIHLIK